MLKKEEKKMIIQEALKLLVKKARLHNIKLDHQILHEFMIELQRILKEINSISEIKTIGQFIGLLINKYSANSNENNKSA